MLTSRRWTLLVAVALLAAACNGGPDVGAGDRQDGQQEHGPEEEERPRLPDADY